MLDHFHRGKGSVLVLLEQMLTLNMDLSFLHEMPLLTLPSVDSQNELFTDGIS